jgi:hypothetical protein
VHVRSAARERGADEGPDGAGSDDRDPHGAVRVDDVNMSLIVCTSGWP